MMHEKKVAASYGVSSEDDKTKKSTLKKYDIDEDIEIIAEHALKAIKMNDPKLFAMFLRDFFIVVDAREEIQE